MVYSASNNGYKRIRYEKGLCQWCSQKRDCEKTLCATCREKLSQSGKTRRDKRLAEVKCTQCGGVIDSNVKGKKCLKCWVRHVAIVSLDDWFKADAIAAILKVQDYKCAYSGIELIPGINACLDHKTPRTRGGSHDLKNIHWVTKDINRVKGTMTHEEFVELARFIVQKFG